MVFFVCSSCGQAIKKNQVEKHYMHQCFNCNSLTCMDCNKEFFGDDYKSHTQCISEDQKYGGKDFQPKLSSNKGELKQELWITKLKNNLVSEKVSPQLSSHINHLLQFSNIPRKKVKFINFVKNSLRLHNSNLIDQIWELFSKAHEKDSAPGKDTAANSSVSENSNGVDIPSKKANEVNHEVKRKRKDEDSCNDNDDQSNVLKKSKKYEANGDTESTAIESVADCGKEIKFKWTKNIKSILREKSEKTMSMKKFQKKIFKAFIASVGESVDCEEQNLNTILQKKLKKCSTIEVTEGRIKLIE